LDGDNNLGQISSKQTIAGIQQVNSKLEVMRLPVVGSSMDPMLRERDILLVNLILPDMLTCGDIIVRGNHELITHRVLVARSNRILTKGDARYWIDPIISRENIWGVVKQVNRNGIIANMESRRWKVINRLIGLCGRILVYLALPEQITGKSRDRKIGWHRTIYWFSKKINWVILFLFARKWIFQKSL
jgi:hypothetical protein